MGDTELDKITILIPTYNRCSFLFRILDYYHKYAPGLRVFVADSSSPENAVINRQSVGSFADLNISYRQYDSNIFIVPKYSDAYNRIETPYVALCGDDDFICPNGMRRSVDFLEKNADFTVAHGFYVSFNLNDEEGFSWHPVYKCQSNASPDPVERFRLHFGLYSYPTFYAVHRTELEQMIFAESATCTDEVRFGELLPTILSLIYGKMKHIDVFYSARESWEGSDAKITMNIHSYVKEGTCAEKYAPFRECLVRHLSARARLGVEDAGRIVDETMQAYYHFSYEIEHIDRERVLASDEHLVCGKLNTQDFGRMLSCPASQYFGDFRAIRDHVAEHKQRVALA